MPLAKRQNLLIFNVGHPPAKWNYDFSIFLKSEYIAVTQVLLIQ